LAAPPPRPPFRISKKVKNILDKIEIIANTLDRYTCTWVKVVGLAHMHFVLSPVSLTSRDQDATPWNTTINIYSLNEK